MILHFLIDVRTLPGGRRLLISLKLLSGYRNTRACGFFIIINIMMISILSFACRRSAIGFGLVPVSSARGFVSPGTPNAVEGQGRYGPSENNGFMWESDNRSGRQIQETIEALRRAEQKYRSIFEHAAEGIFQTTPDGQYLSAYQNSHCEASAGDLVVLFTNGLFEVEMADDEYYGAERLLAAVCKQISLPTCQLFGQVVAEIRRSWGLTTLRLLRLSTLPPLMRWLGLRPSQQLNFFSSGQGADLGTDLEEDFLRGLQTSHNQIVLVSCSKRIGINGSGFGASPSFEVLRRAAGLFAVHPTIQDSIRFDRLSSTSTTTSTSTIDQGSKAILGKSSQENKILTDVVESGQAATKSSSSRAPMNTRGKFLTVNVL